MAPWCRWQVAGLVAAAVALSVGPPPAAAHLTSEYSIMTIQNQLGPGVRAYLFCYQLFIKTHWFKGPEFTWQITFEAILEHGEVVPLQLTGYALDPTKAQCEMVVNKKGDRCIWSIYDEMMVSEDKAGYDRAWYIRPDGVYEQFTGLMFYNHPTRLRYRYCKAFQLEDLRFDPVGH